MIDLGGTFRTVSAEETLALVTPLLGQFGITRVANITGLDHIGIDVYQSIRPNAKLLSVSQGKGTNKALAKVSAIMESIESWHGENIRPPDFVGSYSELCNHYPLIWPDDLSYGPFVSLDPAHARISWIKTTDLRSRQEIYVPYTLLHLNFSHFPEGFEFHFPSTNGLASGNSLEEALCHGLYEIIERDAWVKAVYKEQSCLLVELDTIQCPYLQSLIAKIRNANLILKLFDITSDLKIPTYFAVISGNEALRHTRKSTGFGTHFSKEVAVSRAIAEAAQARLTYISGARDDLCEAEYVQHKKQSPLEASADTIPFLPTEDMPKNFRDCLERLLDRFEKTGYEKVLFYNHTHQELGIPVVHVVVPGLSFFNKKYKRVFGEAN